MDETKMIKKNPISVNLHFWPYCNMKCKYCFANFSHIRVPLSKNDWFRIILLLVEFGIKKINFVGGEPTLCKFLGELIEYSKDFHLITGIVSNGTGMTQQFVDQYGNNIDWIGLSLDSGDEDVQKYLGRGNGNYVQSTINKSKMIKNAGIKLKINSVITRFNYSEDMTELIKIINPNRWKVFQVLEIKVQNSKNVNELLITNAEFRQFVKRHEYLNPIVEDNDAMIDSYAMVDPSGRFFQNTQKIYYFSSPILKVGIRNAFEELKYNYMKFLERGGVYVW